MQNKCNCQNSGFVPVSSNWDFAMNDGYPQRRGRRNADNGCQCERCDDARVAESCEQNTHVRDMDACACSKGNDTRNRNNDCNDCDKCDSTYTRARNSTCNDCDKCENAYTRARNNTCDDCNKCESAYARTRSNGCGDCDKDNGGTYARSHKNRGVGIVNGVMQEIGEIYQSESALRAGTLFPELHKPLNGYCPCDSNCGTCAQQAAFAAWELRLYLNTHPNDEEALRLFRKLCKEAEEENYATTFLTDDCCASNWSWVENPWPWEYSCNCGD